MGITNSVCTAALSSCILKQYNGSSWVGYAVQENLRGGLTINASTADITLNYDSYLPKGTELQKY